MCMCLNVCVTTGRSTIHSSRVRGFRDHIRSKNREAVGVVDTCSLDSLRRGDEKEGWKEKETRGGDGRRSSIVTCRDRWTINVCMGKENSERREEFVYCKSLD